MKKQLLFLSVIFLFLVSSVYAQTVYVTNTGEKYHREDCRYLRKSSIAISLSDAITQGYTACKVCKPPLKVSNSKSTNNANRVINKGNQNYSKSVSVQCSATTKAGRRCKRMTRSPNGQCWQHGGN